MERFTMSLDGALLASFNRYMKKKGYTNRSEAIRDLLRERLDSEQLAKEESGDCVGCLSYVYNHHERELTQRLVHHQHAHHDLVWSTMHVHLDHENCMEVAIVRGAAGAVKQFADSVSTETGVRHATLAAVPVETKVSGQHSYDHHVHGAHHPHTHSRPRT